jgi:hypothetical protein
MELVYWVIIIAQGIICGSFCSFVAQEKNRSIGAWFVNGFLFSLFALIAIAGVSPLSPQTDEDKLLRKFKD